MLIRYEQPTINKQFIEVDFNTDSGRKQMYESMQYLGRYSVWEEIGKEIFSGHSKFVNCLQEDKFYSLYYLLETMKDISEVKGKLRDLGALIDDIWPNWIE